MSGGFSNPLTGQNGALIRQQIQSPNYVPGVSGWIIRKDGSAEFNNALFRGTVSIQNNQAILFYSSTPALGNLVGSAAPVSGVDSLGNAYPAGFMFTNGTLKFQATVESFLGNIVPLVSLSTGGNTENSAFHMASAPAGIAGSTRFYDAKIVSPTNTAVPDFTFIEMLSSSDNGTSVNSQMFMQYGSNINGGGLAENYFNMGCYGISVNAGFITAVKPGTGTSPSNIAAGEVWNTASLAAGFQALAGFGIPRYRLEGIAGGVVRLSGVVQLTANAGTGTTIFTLPSGYMPTTTKVILTANNMSGGTGRIESIHINPGGTITLGQAASTGNYISLDGVTFEVD